MTLRIADEVYLTFLTWYMHFNTMKVIGNDIR